MAKKTILIDMDHVMADITFQFIKWYQRATGVALSREDLLGKPEDLAFPEPGLIREFLHEPGFFLTAPVIPGSQSVIKELNQLYDVYIVSAAMEFPQSLSEKREWLLKHFPFIHWQQIIFCGSKKPVSGDFMIDDHVKNLTHFKGERLLFTATHNIYMQDTGYFRVNNWEEIKDLFLLKNVSYN